MRILGILVIYDGSRTEVSISKFKHDIHALSSRNEILLVSNNKSYSLDVEGSNRCGEFSGWAEGLQAVNFHEYDIVVFANDTYWLNDRFNFSSRELFRYALEKASLSSFVLGEVSWQIYWHNLFYLKPFLLRWVRTSFFALSRDAMQRIESVGASEVHLASLFINSVPKCHFRGNFSPLMLERINKWLFPLYPDEGWHFAQSADDSRLLLKAKCVLQELLLAERCMDAGVKVVNYKRTSRCREMLLNRLYSLSRFLA